MGCGRIAHAFVKALQSLPDATITVASSRTPGRAEAFAEQYEIPRHFDSYEAFVDFDDVDIVYIATTHNFHHENVKLCLEKGKHVLCEKPLTVNGKQARELIDIARDKKLFLMEAVWTRFMPGIKAIHEKVFSGMLGEIQKIEAHFWINLPFDPENRLFNPHLAGGALLDLGIYPITFTDIMTNGEKPVEIITRPVIGATGVDETSYYLFLYKDGKVAALSSSCRATYPMDAWIVGTKGYLHAPNFFFNQEHSVHCETRSHETFRTPFQVNGYEYEAVEAMRCLRAGLGESPLLPVSKTLEIISLMDSFRREWKLVYPGE